MPVQGTHKGCPYQTLHRLFRELIEIPLRRGCPDAGGVRDVGAAPRQALGNRTNIPLRRSAFAARRCPPSKRESVGSSATSWLNA